MEIYILSLPVFTVLAFKYKLASQGLPHPSLFSPQTSMSQRGHLDLQQLGIDGS